VFEGALRKWVFFEYPPLRYACYFSKDAVFVLAALVGLRTLASGLKMATMILMVASVSLLLLPTFWNLSNSDVLGVVLSLRAYLVIPACGFLAAGTIRSLRDVDRIALAVGIMAILVAALGCVQFYLPPGHFLNRYDYGSTDRSVVELFSRVRATGTFAGLGNMTWMSVLACWAAMYLSLGAGYRRRALAVAFIVAGFCCASVAMSRSGLVLSVGVTTLAVLLFRRISEALFLALVFLAAAWAMGSPDPRPVDRPEISQALMQRVTTEDQSHGRSGVTVRFDMAVDELRSGAELPLGVGLGVGQQGANQLRSLPVLFPETEWGRILFEVGWLGFLAVMLWRATAFVMCWKAYVLASTRSQRALLAVTLPTILAFSIANIAFNHTANSFCWAVVAVALGAARLPAPRRPGYGPVPEGRI